MTEITMARSATTRILHAVLAAAIVHQLVVSLLMERPRPGRSGENFAFELHEWVGLSTLGVLALFWAWTLVRKREQPFGALLPWFSRTRRAAVVGDTVRHARSLMKLRVPPPVETTPLASAIHGLGLLVATAMAATGGIVYLVMEPDGSLTGIGDTALEVHRIAANLMWAFLVGHGGIALVHEILGHRILGHMFLGRHRLPDRT